MKETIQDVSRNVLKEPFRPVADTCEGNHSGRWAKCVKERISRLAPRRPVQMTNPSFRGTGTRATAKGGAFLVAEADSVLPCFCGVRQRSSLLLRRPLSVLPCFCGVRQGSSLHLRRPLSSELSSLVWRRPTLFVVAFAEAAEAAEAAERSFLLWRRPTAFVVACAEAAERSSLLLRRPKTRPGRPRRTSRRRQKRSAGSAKSVAVLFPR